MANTYKLLSGKLYRQEEQMNGLLKGDFLVNLPESAETPKMEWAGAKLSLAKWVEIKSILKYAQPSEGIVLLMLNAPRTEWTYFVPPQSGAGASADAKPYDHPGWTPYHVLVGAGYLEFGSVHSHPGFGAFQSGTDSHDEARKEGFHITLGKLDDQVWDIHQRLVIGGSQFSCTLTDWLDMPDVHRLDEYPASVVAAWKQHLQGQALGLVKANAHGAESQFIREVKPLYEHPFPGMTPSQSGEKTGKETSSAKLRGKRQRYVSVQNGKQHTRNGRPKPVSSVSYQEMLGW